MEGVWKLDLARSEALAKVPRLSLNKAHVTFLGLGCGPLQDAGRREVTDATGFTRQKRTLVIAQYSAGIPEFRYNGNSAGTMKVSHQSHVENAVLGTTLYFQVNEVPHYHNVNPRGKSRAIWTQSPC